MKVDLVRYYNIYVSLFHIQADKFDSTIDKSIGNWSKSLPKAPNQDVILLKKARGKKYLVLSCSPKQC